MPTATRAGLVARSKSPLRWLLGVAMISIGVMHFVNPAPFVAIMPAFLPWHLELVWISGAFEIALGAGVLLPATRRASAWGLVALYLAVFPANINMAVNGISPPGGPDIPSWLAWGRLPLQLVLIAWAYWYTRAEPDEASAHTPDA